MLPTGNMVSIDGYDVIQDDTDIFVPPFLRKRRPAQQTPRDTQLCTSNYLEASRAYHTPPYKQADIYEAARDAENQINHTTTPYLPSAAFKLNLTGITLVGAYFSLAILTCIVAIESLAAPYAGIVIGAVWVATMLACYKSVPTLRYLDTRIINSLSVEMRELGPASDRPQSMV